MCVCVCVCVCVCMCVCVCVCVCVCARASVYLDAYMYDVVYTQYSITFTLFHLACITASVYKRKNISAEVNK